MREIKFRAWNPNNPNLNQRMVKDPLHRCDPHDLLDGKKEGFYKDWVLMQYTGLHDRNGKEIYEGDITVFAGDGIFVCKFISGGFSFIRPTTNTISYNFIVEDSEIIGNIWEHPNLLESK